MVAGSAFAGQRPSKSAVLLEITGGDTAFVVDKQAGKAWWVVGQCKRPIAMEKQKKSNKSMLSEVISEQVLIGNRQVNLKQQFRFTLAPNAGPITVEVYNSLRGGWSPVPVELHANCSTDAACRARLEAPEC